MRLMLALSWLPRSKKKFSGNLICKHTCGGPGCEGYQDKERLKLGYATRPQCTALHWT